jgi:hypothetical protein
MRRTVLSIFGLMIGTVVLVGLKSTALGSSHATAAAYAPQNPGGGSGSAGPGNQGAAGPVAGPGSKPGASTGPGGTTRPMPSAGPPGASALPGQTPPAPGQSTSTTTPAGGGGGPTTTTTTTAPPPPPPPPAGGTFTGAAVSVPTAVSPNAKSGQCGDCHNYAISVTLTVSNGRITAASYAYSTSPAGSQSYADRASNALQSQILSAQTWNMGKPVSGCTYAVNAWEQSARSAMQAAGLPV